MVVEIADRDVRGALAHARDDRGRGQRRAAQGEEIGGRPRGGHGEDLRPNAGQPRLDGGQALEGGIVGGAGVDRQRPGQPGLVDLAGGAHRQLVHDVQARDHRGGHLRAQAVHRGIGVDVGGVSARADVTDQDVLAAGSLADLHAGLGDPGQRGQVRLDLAELDAAAADLHLIVDAAHEMQALRLQAHVIAGAVRAVPADGRHGGVLLGVLHRVQVAGQADAADDQLADLAGRHRLLVLVHDHQIPTVQRHADGHRLAGPEFGSTGHDRRLGGAVGVPHLAFRGGQALDQLGRAGFAADDEQAHRIQRLRRPQARQRRHRGHRGDAARDQPRAQVHAGAHQRTRRGHQAGTVPPRDPHLLAGGVECDGQAGEHAVLRAQRAVGVVRQEQPRLGVDERGGAAVGDRHALRLARRSGGEDDPRVVVGGRLAGRFLRHVAGSQVQAVGAEPAGDARLAEDHLGALVGVVGVDGHVGRAGGEDRQDGDVELPVARGHAHAHAIAGADALGAEPAGGLVDFGDEVGIGHHHVAVVERRRLGVLGGGGPQHVHERALRRGQVTAQVRRRDRISHVGH